ncbi:Predicted protein [Selenomonas sp. GACV-9]|uniref:phosphodiester glycosidase family protein n=1 Tax=Selenomonas sp. GACV-9 TaxID=3158782 RepID=UPI0008E86784|nr:Predicted protein [Selenomonas ruminantium]
MNQLRRKITTALLVSVFTLQTAAFASAADLTSVRYHSGGEHDRVVFDLSSAPSYQVKASADGRDITIDFANVSEKDFKRKPFHSSRIESVKYTLSKGHMLVTLRLKAGLTYQANTLSNPARVFVDILPKTAAGSVARPARKSTAAETAAGEGNILPLAFDGLYTEMAAPGLAKRSYVYWDDAGKVSAYFVEADKDLYTVKPVLARGRVPGLQTTSGMSDAEDAVAAVNATYFAGNGDMIGMVKIDGLMAGTTYYTRSAIGFLADGSPVFGPVSYYGQVTLGDVTQDVSGVDAERGADNLTIYNKWYGSRTRTNEYGLEYTVQDGRVTKIQTGDSVIPANGCVISVHGKAMDAFAGVRVGDRAVISQDLGAQWNKAVDIMGAGPRLVQNGRVNVTVAAEQFPGDIRYGRAPRSAVAVLKNGNYLFGVVDGRQSSSHGLTLTEWAELLVKFGARDAINLDGGGSSDLVVGGQVQNSPSDGQERRVGSALILQKK